MAGRNKRNCWSTNSKEGNTETLAGKRKQNENTGSLMEHITGKNREKWIKELKALSTGTWHTLLASRRTLQGSTESPGSTSCQLHTQDKRKGAAGV